MKLMYMSLLLSSTIALNAWDWRCPNDVRKFKTQDDAEYSCPDQSYRSDKSFKDSNTDRSVTEYEARKAIIKQRLARHASCND